MAIARAAEQFVRRSYFEVVGSESGRRYRIHAGTSVNVCEIDERGRLPEPTHKTPEYEDPFLRDTDKSKRYRLLGEWARWLAVIAALCGIVAFCAGLYTAYKAFQNLPH